MAMRAPNNQGLVSSGKGDKFFRTFEFALFPFAPFSKEWSTTLDEGDMSTTGRPGDMAWGPAGVMNIGTPAKEADWLARYKDYDKAIGYGNLQTNIDRHLDQGDIKRRATRLAQELEAVMSGDQIKGGPTIPDMKNYQGHTDTPEKYTFETIETILEDWGISAGGAGNEDWKLKDDAGVALDLSRQVWAKNSRAAAGEQLDFMVKDGRGQSERLEYLLHRIGNYAGAEFVEDAMGIEATTEATSKFLSQTLIDTKNSGDISKDFNTAAETMATDMERMYTDMMKSYKKHFGYKSIEQILNTIKAKPTKAEIKNLIEMGVGSASDYKPRVGKKKGDESLYYITRQFLDRFLEIHNYVEGTSHDSVKSMIYQVPLQSRTAGIKKGQRGFVIGFAKFTPHFTKGGKRLKKTMGISTETFIIDMLDAKFKEEWIDVKFLKEITAASAQGAFRGILDTFLMWDYARATGDAAKIRELKLNVENELFVQTDMGAHGRQHMIGSSAWSMVDDMKIGAADNMVSVVGVQTLTTKEVAMNIKKQFEYSFTGNNPTANRFKGALKALFTRAAEESTQATTSWKGNIPNSATYSLPGESPKIFAREGGPWMDKQKMTQGTGVGIPFAFISGRKGTTDAYKLFTSGKSERLVNPVWGGDEADKPTRKHGDDIFGGMDKTYDYDFMTEGDLFDWRIEMHAGRSRWRFFKGGKRFK